VTGDGHKLQQGKFLLTIRKTFFIMELVSPGKISQQGCGISSFGDTQNLIVQGCCSNSESRPTLSRRWNQITSRDPFQTKLLGDSNHVFEIEVQGHFQS